MFADELAAEPQVMKSEMSRKLAAWRKALEAKLAAEMALEIAKEQYDKQVKDFAQWLQFNGLESVTDNDGLNVSVVTNVRCSLKKDAQSKHQVRDWLNERGMGTLVSETLVVPQSYKEVLDREKIAYDEDLSMNTNQVKAYVKAELDSGNIELQDIPEGLSWFMYSDLKVSK